MADANERLTLAACAFVAGCLLIAPLEVRSSIAAFALSAGLFIWHVRRSKREAPAAAPRSPAPSAALIPEGESASIPEGDSASTTTEEPAVDEDASALANDASDASSSTTEDAVRSPEEPMP